MTDLVAIASLTLGAILILTHVAVAILAAVKAPKRDQNGSLALDAPTKRVFDLLDKLVDKAPLVAAGILLVLIAAVASGTFSASVVFGA